MSVVAVLPIKQLANAKQRLRGVLSDEQRRGLFKAMVQDVLEAVTVCPSIDRAIVVTSDEEVSELAHYYGVEVRPEPEISGLIPAVTATGEALAEEGVRAMLFLPGDVPLVSVEDLEMVADGLLPASEDPQMIIVPAEDLGGTNCLLVAPPNAMTFGFGVDSYRRHEKLAEAVGVHHQTMMLASIGLDVDEPHDLDALVEYLGNDGMDTHSYRFLRTIGAEPGFEPMNRVVDQ
ncbi:MAG: 2-phospho-L-lactate guanylyltransferase [Gammaproteobacteria bacterium]|uniref:3-phospho-D-glycerate guanylyltransferase n=1 Tax=OM182 bacterium MED-G24 TaxID=1986255 RepID=A0A2A5WU43_9GAMM|nr:2-phospho-L-lactate guanylyltransferase [Gammaproteobacteria bacterium]PDH39646.1 MAG: 2-phospho-L-lactate guanylyltransferase [OM182 bacterium MED-G24]RPG25514.1 MAG: 2-phospho-L-lactate guanylyltransferase [Gammaproteobacteria bacterium TMED50]|tara:strand:+ start:250 stop:948 length:699 start_codon:yes stop_codon:yes gene_type:complete